LVPGEVLNGEVVKEWIIAATHEPQRLIDAAEAVAQHAVNYGFSNSEVHAIIYGRAALWSTVP